MAFLDLACIKKKKQKPASCFMFTDKLPRSSSQDVKRRIALNLLANEKVSGGISGRPKQNV